jgi:phenylacetate-CoA ligase
VIQEVGYDLQRDLYLEVGFVADEMLPESLCSPLEESFGMIVCQGCGTADVGCLAYECYHKDGMHFAYNCVMEIVDPDTGRQLGPGETGEVVATVFHEACPCGGTANRMVKILGRLNQAPNIKGMLIHPAKADEVAARLPEIDRYQVVVTLEAHVDQMSFTVELKEGIEASQELAERIEAAIPSSMRVRGKVRFIDRGILPEKYKKIDDRRKWD